MKIMENKNSPSETGRYALCEILRHLYTSSRQIHSVSNFILQYFKHHQPHELIRSSSVALKPIDLIETIERKYFLHFFSLCVARILYFKNINQERSCQQQMFITFIHLSFRFFF